MAPILALTLEGGQEKNRRVFKKRDLADRSR